MDVLIEPTLIPLKWNLFLQSVNPSFLNPAGAMLLINDPIALKDLIPLKSCWLGLSETEKMAPAPVPGPKTITIIM